MATYNSSTVFNPIHPPLALASHPLENFFQEIHNLEVTFRGISGRILVEDEDVYLYPDDEGFCSQAYQDDVARMGDEWYRWCLTEDTPALMELSQMLITPLEVNIDLRPPYDPRLSEEEGFDRGLLYERSVSLIVYPGMTEDVTPLADWVDGLFTLMGLD